MKILVTGASGFIGKNLVANLKTIKDVDVLEYDVLNNEDELEQYCSDCDFVFHLAGVNRPIKKEDFMIGNFDFTNLLLHYLRKANNHCPIVFSSSIQVMLDNEYGKSKLKAEELLKNHSMDFGADVFVYRLCNVFGKWSAPNYNSVVATFCYNIQNDLPIKINDEKTEINLAYIDDVIESFIECLNSGGEKKFLFGDIEKIESVSLGDLAEILFDFKECQKLGYIPTIDSYLKKCLYSTFQSYIPENMLEKDLSEKRDDRGLFCEVIKSNQCGQISVNIIKPNITKGNHWHNSKMEKFLVVSGVCEIGLRKVTESKVHKFIKDSNNLSVVEIPCGYIHTIKNVGTTDAVVLIWCNDVFNKDKADTFFKEI